MRACQHCGMENDDTRVFCSNCGTRLPAVEAVSEVAAPKAPQIAVKPPAVSTAGASAPPLPRAFRPSVKKPVKPVKKGTSALSLSPLFWTLVLAALLAAIIQMAREPDNIPPKVGASAGATGAASATLSTLRELVTSPQPSSWTVNGKAINQFLETTIQMKPSIVDASAVTVEFQRAFVQLQEGSFQLGIEQKFLERHFYFLLEGQPEASGSGLEVKWSGGSIGRLPVHPALIPVFLRLFQPTITGLAQPLDLLRQTSLVKITPVDATFQCPGTGKSVP